MTMSQQGPGSSVLTIRLGAELSRALEGTARRRRTTKSELVRRVLTAALAEEDGVPDLAEEARRQSLLVSDRESERETLEFLEHAADTRGWR
jgi:metal-responsive CopG/Arc/MetJ family transcriptional regulator